MKSEAVLYVGRSVPRADSLVDVIQKNYPLYAASSGKAALGLISVHKIRVMILDAASLRTPGERICRELRSALPDVPLIHILPPDSPGATCTGTITVHAPITPRRLMNQIKRALSANRGEVIECGPFSMNVPLRVLTAYGTETQLNPKLSALVEYFLRHPNETIERKTLMESVWQTDYVGDTRTLNVHIRWARAALEDHGKHPRHLKTVRGVGYRLEVGVETLKGKSGGGRR